MGFFKDALRVGVGVGTLGGSEVFNEASGGGLYGNGSTFISNSGSSDDPNAGMAANNAQITAEARQRAKNKQAQFYGTSIDNLGAESQDYANRTKANLDKNVAKADQYNQQAGQQRAIDNARAGLSGVDTSAMNEQGRRNASFGAAAINEDAKRNALDLYGQSISNRITGANTIDTQEQALGIASLQQPVAQAGQGGILSSIFGGLF